VKWFSRLKSAVKAAVTNWKGSTFDFSNWSGKTFWGTDNSKLATNETIFSVVTRLSNSMAMLPLKLYRNYDVVTNDVSDLVTTSPNPNMTAFEFIRNKESMRDEKGNAYSLIERDIRWRPTRLTPLNPDYVEPVVDRDSGELWYQVIGDKGTYYFHNTDVLHVKHIVGSGGLKGINPIKVLTNATDYDKAVRDFSLSEMQMAPNSFILEYAQNVSPEKRNEIIADFKRFYQDNGGVLFKEPGVKIDSIERKYVSTDTFQSERITRARVANVYNMPVIMLNDTEGQSYSSNEQLMRMFVQLTLMPIVQQYEQEFNRKLLTPEERRAGYYFKFNVNSLLRGDMAARTAFYQMMIRSAGMKPDEARRLEDLPPEGGMADKLWISGDLYPIDFPVENRKGVSDSAKATKE
jgi:HK97 family phage portal protein